MRGVTGSLRDDEGFSVIEVMVSLTLLTVTMAAMGPFLVRSFLVVGQQRADQAAIELANSAVEQVRALKGRALLSGRAEGKSTDQWQEAYDTGPEVIKSYLAVPGRAIPSKVNRKLTMKLAWDPDPATNPDAGEEAAISTLPQEMPLDKTFYTRSIFVGECNVYMMNLPGYLRTSGDCVNPDIVLAPAVSDPRVLRFFRVVVLVTWTDKICDTGRCSRTASTLISRAPDPRFKFNRPWPELSDQEAVFYVDRPGEYELKARGGQLPIVWAVDDPLPAGLILNQTKGTISGTPTTAGRYEKLRVTVTDDADPKRSASEKVLTIDVLPPPSVIVPSNLRHVVGAAVTQQLMIVDGRGPYVVVVKNLPPGLTTDLGVDGLTSGPVHISGTATAPGTYKVTVEVTDVEGMTGTGDYTHINFFPVQLDPIPDQTIDLGSMFDFTAVGLGGDGAYTYSATGLPSEVRINPSTGVLSGQPIIPGSYQKTVIVTDGLGSTFSDTFVLVVTTSTALNLTSPGDQASTVDSAVDLVLQSNKDLLGLKPKFSATGLPDGLHLNPAQGTISGKLKTAGTYGVTITATNQQPPQTSVVTFVWTIR